MEVSYSTSDIFLCSHQPQPLKENKKLGCPEKGRAPVKRYREELAEEQMIGALLCSFEGDLIFMPGDLDMVRDPLPAFPFLAEAQLTGNARLQKGRPPHETPWNSRRWQILPSSFNNGPHALEF